MASVEIKQKQLLSNNLFIYYNGEFFDYLSDIDITNGVIKFSIGSHNFEYKIPNFKYESSSSGSVIPLYGLLKDKFFYSCFNIQVDNTRCYLVYTRVDLTNYVLYANSYVVDMSDDFTSYYCDFVEIDNIEYILITFICNNLGPQLNSTIYYCYIFNENSLFSSFHGILDRSCNFLKIDYNKNIMFLYDNVNKTLLSYNYNNKEYINQNISSSIFQEFVNNILDPNFSNLAYISNKLKDNKFYFLFSNKAVVFTIIDENNISNYEVIDFQIEGYIAFSGPEYNYTSIQQYNFGSIIVAGSNENAMQNVVLINDEATSNYNITLKFDNDVVKTYTKTTDTILKAVRISLLGGSITANLTYSKGDNDFISTLEYPNSYKYATSVTIGENTYNITDNVVEVNDLNISSDVEIKLNNGVIAYYDITFKNDTKLLQIKRTKENTLPVYEGETPEQAGKVFIGWTPAPYPVDKQQYYQAQFSVESSSIITFKKKDGTTKTYSAVKFVKKDGTSKTYTSVKLIKKGAKKW